jgi:potassium/hydrogen antiporter
MEKPLIIIFIGVLVFLAHAFVVLFQKLKIPDILYLILIGLIIGPILNLTSPEDFGKTGPIFTTIALVVILFEGGLELNFDMIRKTLRNSITLILLTYFITSLLLVCYFFFLMKYDLLTSTFISSVLAGPAPAVIIPLIKHLNLSKQTRITLTLEAGLGEALCILVSLAIFESLKLKDIQTGKAIGNIISSFLLASVIGFIAGYFWSLVLNKIRNLRNAIFTTPSFVFIIYGLCEFLGFSGPIGVLALGATLCNIKFLHLPIISEKINLLPIEHNETEKLFFGEIVFLLKTFFFVYLGLSIAFKDIYFLMVAGGAIVIIIIVRIITVRVLFRKDEIYKSDKSIISIMISKGLATAVLGSLLFEFQLPRGDEIQNLIYYIILLSIIANSIFVFILEKRKTVTTISNE